MTYLWQQGYRFRKNVKDLEGKPDIAIKKYKLAIFIEKQKIDVGKISEEERKMITKEFLKILKRDWNNPEIRVDYEKWLNNKYKAIN